VADLYDKDDFFFVIIILLFLQAFAIFCGMGIYNTHMYETAVRASAKQRVAIEVLSYHVSAPSDECAKVKVNISISSTGVEF
jgi:hypothetical protein